MKNNAFIIQIWIVICFLAFSEGSYAQGFLGKRMTIGYWYQSAVSVDFDLYSSQPEFTFEYQQSHQAEMGYVLGRRSEIGLAGLHYSIPLQLYQGRMFGIGGYYKFFASGKGAIAPVGTWYQLKILRISGNAINPNNPDGDRFSIDFNQLRFAAGRQFPLWRNVLFSVGVESGFPLYWLRFEFRTYEKLERREFFSFRFGLVVPLI